MTSFSKQTNNFLQQGVNAGNTINSNNNETLNIQNFDKSLSKMINRVNANFSILKTHQNLFKDHEQRIERLEDISLINIDFSNRKVLKMSPTNTNTQFLMRTQDQDQIQTHNNTGTLPGSAQQQQQNQQQQINNWVDNSIKQAKETSFLKDFERINTQQSDSQQQQQYQNIKQQQQQILSQQQISNNNIQQQSQDQLQENQQQITQKSQNFIQEQEDEEMPLSQICQPQLTKNISKKVNQIPQRLEQDIHIASNGQSTLNIITSSLQPIKLKNIIPCRQNQGCPNLVREQIEHNKELKSQKQSQIKPTYNNKFQNLNNQQKSSQNQIDENVDNLEQQKELQQNKQIQEEIIRKQEEYKEKLEKQNEFNQSQIQDLKNMQESYIQQIQELKNQQSKFQDQLLNEQKEKEEQLQKKINLLEKQRKDDKQLIINQENRVQEKEKEWDNEIQEQKREISNLKKQNDATKMQILEQSMMLQKQNKQIQNSSRNQTPKNSNRKDYQSYNQNEDVVKQNPNLDEMNSSGRSSYIESPRRKSQGVELKNKTGYDDFIQSGKNSARSKRQSVPSEIDVQQPELPEVSGGGIRNLLNKSKKNKRQTSQESFRDSQLLEQQQEQFTYPNNKNNLMQGYQQQQGIVDEAFAIESSESQLYQSQLSQQQSMYNRQNNFQQAPLGKPNSSSLFQNPLDRMKNNSLKNSSKLSQPPVQRGNELPPVNVKTGKEKQKMLNYKANKFGQGQYNNNPLNRINQQQQQQQMGQQFQQQQQQDQEGDYDEVVYQLDEEGFLLDEEGNYLLDEDGQFIRLDGEQLDNLRDQNLIVEEEYN